MSNLTKQEVNSCADEFIFIYNVVYFAQNIILNWKPEKACFFFLNCWRRVLWINSQRLEFALCIN